MRVKASAIHNPPAVQTKILWEAVLKRFPVIEVVGEPKRVFSNFVRGFTELQVRLPG